MIEIDGSMGEGGGQVLRTALALSMVTARPFRMRSIRAGREKPGLLRQHLAAVRAAKAVSAATVTGDIAGSDTLEFVPGAIQAGSYAFSVGTAGSTTLVLQAVLPALLIASGPSRIELEGGTHNPFAPPFEFFARVLTPMLERMGPRIASTLDRPGFYPAGGGRITAEVTPASRLQRIEVLDRGREVALAACARVANLSSNITERELAALRAELRLEPSQMRAETVDNAVGPGNVVMVEIESGTVIEIFTGFGRRDLSSAQVSQGVAREVKEYLAGGAPVGPYLADQLLVPMAIGGGGRYRTGPPSAHTRTVAEIIPMFTESSVTLEQETDSVWGVDVKVPPPQTVRR